MRSTRLKAPRRPSARAVGLASLGTMANTTVRRLFLVVAALLAAGAVAVASGLEDEGEARVGDYLDGNPGRVVVIGGSEGLRAEFPAQPKRRTQSVKVGGARVPVVDYTGGSSTSTFTVSYAQLPEGQDVGDPLARLKASANGAAEAVKGTLLAAGVTAFVGQPAVEYVISTGGRYVKTMSFISGRRLYGIQVVGEDNPPAGYDRFVSTVQLGG